MNVIKSKNWSRLTDSHLNNCLRAGTSAHAPNVPNVYAGGRNSVSKIGLHRKQKRHDYIVKSKQELELKVKSFIPPYAEEPEVYIKEGAYTLVRSASASADIALSRVTSSVNHSGESSAEDSVAAEFQNSAVEHSSLPEVDKRSLSLDRTEDRIPMAFVDTVVYHQTQRKPSRNRNSRPPTPRVTEKTFVPKQQRTVSVASSNLAEAIRESPTEQMEENGNQNQTLDVAIPQENALNSPPPRPQSGIQQTENEEVQIPVPTPTTPMLSGKDETGTINVSETDTSNNTSAERTTKEGETDDTLIKASEEAKLSSINTQISDNDIILTNEKVISSAEEIEKSSDIQLNSDDGDSIEKEESVKQASEDENVLEYSHTSFDHINSKMGNEDVIVDPIKLLQGEGESLKSAEENGRDHYDEGFHSGELMASEEDSNSIETLGDSGIKDEHDLAKPIRAATPMPRSSSFYKPLNMDLEITDLQKRAEELRAERKLKELKRDSLLQKVRDLQRRKVSTKDQAREEWRKRFLEVKKITPRLEDHCSKLRQELEKLVKDMLVSIKTDPDSKPHKPSKKTSYKIMIMRLLQEVEDLRRRLQSVTVRLNAETKLRAQAEYEVKKLRQDLLHKKTQVTLTRKQTSFPQPSEQFFISAV
ncbi:uncharacterized protein LOC118185749 [Stegodyphus dumicola]|uniref:uncharacterized protein LOC118185749 n=1 Tax=Stegodyphus dumicola TaxID=202533 RepID=UPI0015AEDC18|nr:uncharacterized protein LOC118185749 [Stegodyphus dumicola]